RTSSSSFSHDFIDSTDAPTPIDSRRFVTNLAFVYHCSAIAPYGELVKASIMPVCKLGSTSGTSSSTPLTPTTSATFLTVGSIDQTHILVFLMSPTRLIGVL